MMRTAISAVEGVAGGGTEAGHGWTLADGPDSRQDPCAPPTHDGALTRICPARPQLLTERQAAAMPHAGTTPNTHHLRCHALALTLRPSLPPSAPAVTTGITLQPCYVCATH